MPDPLWYKDAIIYEVHVKAFFDSNGDGVGDFAGLTSKLDYLQALGITCLWLLPFYPSPLRDDGYDISGTKGSTRPTARSATSGRSSRRRTGAASTCSPSWWSTTRPTSTRGSRRARRAPPGSPERDFYVWSDTKQRYEDARIIFTDTETSNWTWDARRAAPTTGTGSSTTSPT